MLLRAVLAAALSTDAAPEPASLVEYEERRQQSVKAHDREAVKRVDDWYETHTRPANLAMFACGITMVGLGGLGVIAGLVVIAAGASEEPRTQTSTTALAGVVVTSISGALVLAGIPLTIVGGQRITDARVSFVLGPTSGLTGAF